MIEEEQIRAVATDAAYQRGLRYFSHEAVEEISQKEDGSYTATVAGTEPYHVRVSLTEDGSDIASFHCNCPAAFQYPGACKHVVAVLKVIQGLQRYYSQSAGAARQDGKSAAGTDAGGRHLLQNFRSAKQALSLPRLQKTVYLVPRLFVTTSASARSVESWLEFRLGTDRLYVMRNVMDFLQITLSGGEYQLGRNALQTASLRWADAISKKLWQFMKRTYLDEKALFRYNPNFSYMHSLQKSTIFEHKMMHLSPSMLEEFLAIMGKESIELHINDSEAIDVHQREKKPKLRLTIRQLAEKNGLLTLEDEDMMPLSEDFSLLYQNGGLYHVDEDFGRALRPLWQTFAHNSSVRLSHADMAAFFNHIMPAVEKIAEVETDPAFEEEFMLVPLSVELYLDYEGDGIAVKPVFAYEETRFNPLTEAEPVQDEQHLLVRDLEAEQSILMIFAQYGFAKRHDQFVQPDEEKSYEFLTDGLEAMPDFVEIFYEESFTKRPVRPLPKITAGVSLNDTDLLEVTFDMKEVDFAELIEILASYRQKKRYHRMKDRSFVTLGEQQLQAIAELVEHEGLTGKKKLPADNKIELPMAEAMYLDALARDEEGLQLVRSSRFRELVRDIRQPQDADYEVPLSLQNVLRDYQVTGFSWLSSLADHHLGGILADDMGLGKTLQVIAFLLARRGEGRPSLVVTPTSLLYNWLEEIHRFAPELKVMVVAGSKVARELQLQEMRGIDVVVATYDTLKRDIAMYEKITFRYIFLDEAQHIKNPVTKSARAVKRLAAKSRFALTGTPIENTLTELWSIFDFLMPGYLGTQAKFKERYEVPIVRAEDKKAAKKLQQRVMPFVLRRMKKDVLKELPDKVERKLVGEMTPQQTKVYQAYFMKSQHEFSAELRLASPGERRMKILAILTRLRQIACDPSLFLESYRGGSGKLDMLEELIDDAMAGNHRLLIFSQFTTMLSHIAARLKKKKIDYFYLDGTTPALTRMKLVRQYNEGSVPIFLISLKAGGTGLNLTGADMVVHFDPWWNPAVEDQATDRAYRLGQQSNVQVFKLIMKGTVEEKIYELQEKKKNLIDQMIKPGENFLTKLTEEEIQALFKA
ncbi:MAG: SNF2 helicase associated domain-containing protein [Mitsuokella sp.]|uniref:DEAD/DEAH box helicase n=1 Tax=Mitsuokella sp. TaxID=2049034 RepID=UPI003F060A63